MITFLDGPAEGQKLSLRRAPLYLRAVQARNGRWDALDQLDDSPKPGERVHVYVKAADHGGLFVRLSPRSASGYYPRADYRLCEEQPADDVARDTEQWRAWAEEQREQVRRQHPTA
jgi:hypothetical protein